VLQLQECDMSHEHEQLRESDMSHVFVRHVPTCRFSFKSETAAICRRRATALKNCTQRTSVPHACTRTLHTPHTHTHTHTQAPVLVNRGEDEEELDKDDAERQHAPHQHRRHRPHVPVLSWTRYLVLVSTSCDDMKALSCSRII
jgi:hypothetical protein